MIHLYTDGSCSAVNRVGGWAFYSPTLRIQGSDSELDTTISRMELKAAIMGLAEIGVLNGASRVTVFSDSEYVIKGIVDRSRKRNHNQDLWRLLDNVTDSHEQVEYTHVKGHSGDDGNERVDEMAGVARKSRLAEYEQANTGTCEIRVATYLVDRMFEWVPGYELTAPEVGGSEGLKRMRYLRKTQGFDIEGRKMKDSTAWEYRLVGIE